MNGKKIFRIILILAVIGAVIYFGYFFNRQGVVLTGIVTTDEVVVSSEIQGRLQQLKVKEGDAVKKGDLLALIQPKEWQADMSFYSNSVNQADSQVRQAEIDVRYQEEQTSNQIAQADANVSAADAQITQAEAQAENSRLNSERIENLFKQGVESAQAHDQARTTYDAAKAQVESLRKQAAAARAALALAKSTRQQVEARRVALDMDRNAAAASGAQAEKAQTRLGYTQIESPITGVVDVRAALEGEVVNPAQPIVTIIDPDNLWIRADVEEGQITKIGLGQKLPIRLPSGEAREGTVFYRGVDADFATQRDVSRTKRDIKTFEIRLRCDNHDRALAVGMSAYVSLPTAK